jgi:hypothetical protein
MSLNEQQANGRANGQKSSTEPTRRCPFSGAFSPVQEGPLASSTPLKPGGEARRERKATRESEAALDRLTVLARFSVALARKASYADLEDVVAALIREAKAGKVAAARLLLQYVQLLAETEDDESTDYLDPDQMSPAQRAAAMAHLQRFIEEHENATNRGGR